MLVKAVRFWTVFIYFHTPKKSSAYIKYLFNSIKLMFNFKNIYLCVHIYHMYVGAREARRWCLMP